MANESREPSIPLPGERSSGTATSTRDSGRRPFDDGGPRSRSETTERNTAAAPSAARAGVSAGRIGVAIAALLIGVILGAGGWALVSDARQGDGFGGTIDTKRYQAVILTNDKVYFGRVSSVSDQFFRLDDAFFLRETQDNANASPVRSLLPINRELHAPENRMLIRKDEVVLVENLASDSPVLKEIQRQKGSK